MFSKPHSKKFILSVFVSLGAALLFVSGLIFAQTPPSKGNANDFDNDVKQGKNELQKDPEAQRRQKEVVDGEDGEAGESDGQNNQQGVDEYGDIQNAENNQGVNEENKDINNSGVDEVGDANDLDEESQEVINEHRVQEEGEVENEQQGEQETSTQEGDSSPEQNQPKQNSNQ